MSDRIRVARSTPESRVSEREHYLLARRMRASRNVLWFNVFAWLLLRFVHISVKNEPGLDIALAAVLLMLTVCLFVISLVLAVRSGHWRAVAWQSFVIVVLVGEQLVKL